MRPLRLLLRLRLFDRLHQDSTERRNPRNRRGSAKCQPALEHPAELAGLGVHPVDFIVDAV